MHPCLPYSPPPLQVLVATGDGGTDRLYRFPRLMLTAAQHMCLFEHVDGCKFCEALYGHYLLPNGMLAHFYLGDTVVKVRAGGSWQKGGGPRATVLAGFGGMRWVGLRGRKGWVRWYGRFGLGDTAG